MPFRSVLRLCLAALLCGAMAAHAADAQDYSAAEKLLFMTDQLGKLRPPVTLRYAFHRSGTLEEAFDDQVTVAFSKAADGKCCVSSPEFLSGARRVPVPEVEGASGNPVLMYFLEREVREMQRLTKGSQSHFRKRIRMAIYSGATVRELALNYRGQDVRGHEVLVSPYLDDPNRPRYEKLALKEYRFLLSDAVPGGIYGIRTRIPAVDAAAAPLQEEELLIDGAAASRVPGRS